jgi:hypothetical protein
MDGAILGPGLSADGPGVLVCVSFAAKDTGTAELNLLEIFLRDGDNLDIPFLAEDGVVRILQEAVSEGGGGAFDSPLTLSVSPTIFADGLALCLRGRGEERIRVRVFDPLGREIRSMGEYQATVSGRTIHWNGSDRWGRTVSGGLYFILVESANPPKTRIVKPVVKVE